MVTARTGDREDIQGFPDMSMARVPRTPLIQLLIDPKLFLIIFVTRVDFKRHILTSSHFVVLVGYETSV